MRPDGMLWVLKHYFHETNPCGTVLEFFIQRGEEFVYKGTSLRRKRLAQGPLLVGKVPSTGVIRSYETSSSLDSTVGLC